MSTYKVVSWVKDPRTNKSEGFYCENTENPNEGIYIKDELFYKTTYKEIDAILNKLTVISSYCFSVETYRMEEFCVEKGYQTLYHSPNIPAAIKISDPKGSYTYYYKCDDVERASNIIKAAENILYTVIFPSLHIASIQFSGYDGKKVRYSLLPIVPTGPVYQDIVKSLEALGKIYNFRVKTGQREAIRWQKNVTVINLYFDENSLDVGENNVLISHEHSPYIFLKETNGFYFHMKEASKRYNHLTDGHIDESIAPLKNARYISHKLFEDCDDGSFMILKCGHQGDRLDYVSQKVLNAARNRFDEIELLSEVGYSEVSLATKQSSNLLIASWRMHIDFNDFGFDEDEVTKTMKHIVDDMNFSNDSLKNTNNFSFILDDYAFIVSSFEYIHNYGAK